MQNKFHLKIIFIFLLIFTSLTFNGCSIESKQIVPEIYKSGQVNFHRVCAQCHGIDAIGGNRAPTFYKISLFQRIFQMQRLQKLLLTDPVLARCHLKKIKFQTMKSEK